MNACPQCEMAYTPVFATKAEAMKSGDQVQREQWISGICSQKCWDDLFAPVLAMEAEEDAKEAA